jgi:hypothetical protein
MVVLVVLRWLQCSPSGDCGVVVAVVAKWCSFSGRVVLMAVVGCFG